MVEGDHSHPIAKGCILERPKVVYNKKTGKYVMWFHLELKGKGYGSAYAGVATATKPTGPFKFLKAGRVDQVGIGVEVVERGVRRRVLA